MLQRVPSLILILFALSLGMAGCSSVPPHEYDPEADFSALERWQWKTPEYGNGDVADPILDSQLLGMRVEMAVDAALGARNYTRDSDNPDFTVTYHTSKDFELFEQGPRFSVGLHQVWDHMHTGLIYDSRTRTTMNKKGILIIDVHEGDGGKLIWRGWATLPLEQEYFKSEKLTETVARILSNFPPEVGNER